MGGSVGGALTCRGYRLYAEASENTNPRDGSMSGHLGDTPRNTVMTGLPTQQAQLA